MSLRDVDSPVLLERFGALLRRDHRVTAGVLCYIAEIDRRQLWAEQGYSSMFQLCVEEFHMSEAQADKRIHAARTMVRFPLVGEMVANGELHLTAVQLLSSQLTEDNHREVLARARHRSKREIQKLIAELAPKPDVPSRIKKVATRRPAASARSTARGSLFDQAGPTPEGDKRAEGAPCDSASAAPVHSERRRSYVEPLRPQRYKLEMTIGELTHVKLARAQALLSHRVPGGDPAALFDLALDALLERAERERAAATSCPKPRARTSAGRTRHVPADVRRAVWKRDGARCAYVSHEGRRCTETRWLELHHREPFARGGEHTVECIELRCRPHNQYEANRDYGKRFMDEKRRQTRAREQLMPCSPCAPPAAPSRHMLRSMFEV